MDADRVVDERPGRAPGAAAGTDVLPDADAVTGGAAPETDTDPGQHRFRRLHAMREWIRARPHAHLAYRVLVAIVGGLVIVIGLILVPLPGPGWLVVFVGLTILASEFAFFHRISIWLRRKLHGFWDRVRHRTPSSR
jgi:uncharacterized protein (TIGR02611 family)